MSFKDYVKSDITSTFIDDDIFGDEVTIDGKLQRVVIDDDRLQRKMAEYGALATGVILYFIPVSAFSKKPEIGSVQMFNNRPMYVEDVREHMGLYEILLNQNRSG